MSDITLRSSLSSAKIAIAKHVLFTFIGYLCIGLPLAIVPIFVHQTLGFSELTAGVVISLQYVTTFLIRGYSGQLIDQKGPRIAVLISMIGFFASGILLFFAFYSTTWPLMSLALLAVSRLIMGCAEGMIGASPISWAMLVAGREHTSTAISYNGVASYGALALGAPIGVFIQQSINLPTIGILILILSVAGFLIAKRRPTVTPILTEEPPISFLQTLRIVAPFGISLGLAGIGFGGISNFITLYYYHFSWENAAYSLSLFSVMFVLGRILFADAIKKYGGIYVALICLMTEMFGLLLLYSATTPLVALFGAAVAGLGFSLVFPALGVEAVKRAPVASSGAAIAAFGLFIDLSLGVTGPFGGAVIKYLGMSYLFACCALMAAVGVIIVLCLKLRGDK